MSLILGNSASLLTTTCANPPASVASLHCLMSAWTNTVGMSTGVDCRTRLTGNGSVQYSLHTLGSSCALLLSARPPSGWSGTATFGVGIGAVPDYYVQFNGLTSAALYKQGGILLQSVTLPSPLATVAPNQIVLVIDSFAVSVEVNGLVVLWSADATYRNAAWVANASLTNATYWDLFAFHMLAGTAPAEYAGSGLEVSGWYGGSSAGISTTPEYISCADNFSGWLLAPVPDNNFLVRWSPYPAPPTATITNTYLALLSRDMKFGYVLRRAWAGINGALNRVTGSFPGNSLMNATSGTPNAFGFSGTTAYILDASNSVLVHGDETTSAIRRRDWLVYVSGPACQLASITIEPFQANVALTQNIGAASANSGYSIPPPDLSFSPL